MVFGFLGGLKWWFSLVFLIGFSDCFFVEWVLASDLVFINYEMGSRSMGSSINEVLQATSKNL